MAQMTLSLPEEMREFVDAAVAAGAFPTASAFVQGLIRERMELARVRHMILDGFSSGGAFEYQPGSGVDALRAQLDRWSEAEHGGGTPLAARRR